MVRVDLKVRSGPDDSQTFQFDDGLVGFSIREGS